MNAIVVLLFLIAAVMFGISGYVTKSLVAWGLCLLTVALVINGVFSGHFPVHY